MSKYVWVSTAPGSVTAEFGFGWPEAQFDKIEDRAAAYTALEMDSEKGHPLSASRFPSVLETNFKPTRGDSHRTKLPKKLPPYVKWTCPVISKEIADLMQQFDIGPSNLFPVEMRRADMDVSYDQAFFILNVGVAKDSLVPDQSLGLREYKKSTNFLPI